MMNYYERYQPDVVLAYNDLAKEAEAFGCRVKYSDYVVPSIDAHVLNDDKTALARLPMPDPYKTARLPGFLEQCEALVKAKPPTAIGAVAVGPWTISILLRNPETLLLDTFEDPQFIHDLMRVTTDFCKTWGDAIVKTGIGLSFSEPTASISLISPDNYRDFVAPYHKDLVDHFKAKKVGVTTHICGTTYPIFEDVIQCGFTTFSFDLDQQADPKLHVDQLQRFVEVSRGRAVAIGNVDATTFEKTTKEAMYAEVKRCVDAAARHSGFILSTSCEIPPRAAGPQPRDALRLALPFHGFRGTVGIAAVAAAAASRTAPATPRPAAAGPRTAARAGRLRVRDLDRDPPAVELTPVQLGDRGLRLLRGGHFDEAEAPRLAREPIGDDRRGKHVAALGEELSKSVARGRVGETADVQFGRHVNPLGLVFRCRLRPANRKKRCVGGEVRAIRPTPDSVHARSACASEGRAQGSAGVFSTRSCASTGRVSTRKPASSKAARASSGASGRTVTTTGTPGATRSKSAACSPGVRLSSAPSTAMRDTGVESRTRTPSLTFSAIATPTPAARQPRPSRCVATRSLSITSTRTIGFSFSLGISQTVSSVRPARLMPCRERRLTLRFLGSNAAAPANASRGNRTERP